MGVNRININNTDSNYTHSIFDISEYTGKSYETLLDALEDIPKGKQKGGMTISYQNVNNKYMQYVLLQNTYSIIESNWQEVNNIKAYSSDSSNFFVQDPNGYAVFGVVDGHIKTKYFNSSTINLQTDNNGYGDLSFKDINDYNIASFINGHIETKNFNSSAINYSNLSDELKNLLTPSSRQDIIKIPLRKSVKVLFIGNSISQDHATYIPWLLSTLYNGNSEDKIDFTIGIFYIGSHMIKQYAEENWDTLKASIWSFANNTATWSNTQNATSLNQALQAADWDIISIQGYFNTAQTDDVTKAVQFVSRLRQQVQNNFKLAYLIHQTYRGDAMFKTILEAAATVIQQNDVSILFAPGIANEYAKEYFTTSQLSPDSTHNEEGLPCMIGAYECLCEILQELKSENVIQGDTNILTLAIWQTLNIPGPNGTMDEALNTQKNYEYIQECALFAFNKAKILLENLKTSNIYNYVKVNNN